MGPPMRKPDYLKNFLNPFLKPGYLIWQKTQPSKSLWFIFFVRKMSIHPPKKFYSFNNCVLFANDMSDTEYRLQKNSDSMREPESLLKDDRKKFNS